jgi:hypothetical protein
VMPNMVEVSQGRPGLDGAENLRRSWEWLNPSAAQTAFVSAPTPAH